MSVTRVGYALRTKTTFKCKLFSLFMRLLLFVLLCWNHCVCITGQRQSMSFNVEAIANIVYTHIHTHTHFLVLTIKGLRINDQNSRTVHPVTHIIASQKYFPLKRTRAPWCKFSFHFSGTYYLNWSENTLL